MILFSDLGEVDPSLDGHLYQVLDPLFRGRISHDRVRKIGNAVDQREVETSGGAANKGGEEVNSPMRHAAQSRKPRALPSRGTTLLHPRLPVDFFDFSIFCSLDSVCLVIETQRHVHNN